MNKKSDMAAAWTLSADSGVMTETTPSDPVRVSSGTMMGYLIGRPDPVITGGVNTAGGIILKVVISKQGDVIKLEPVSGSPMLQEAVMKTVKGWKYRPYLVQGEPVEVATTITTVW
jgi:protein TonB